MVPIIDVFSCILHPQIVILEWLITQIQARKLGTLGEHFLWNHKFRASDYNIGVSSITWKSVSLNS